MSDWKQPKFVKQYVNGATDTSKNWYEYEINFDSLADMIPEGCTSVLDFGCGSGEFSYKLAERFECVASTD